MLQPEPTADRPGSDPESGGGARGGTPADFRAGFVALVGLPNVGKSTVLNALVGRKLSIVTPKVQTTRRRVSAILTDEGHQAVFLDTPGLVEPRYALHEAMREDAARAERDADVVVRVVDAGFASSVEEAVGAGPGEAPAAVLCLNKLDRVSGERAKTLSARFREAGWEAVVGTTATEGEGIEALRTEILDRLPTSPPLYPVDEVSAEPVRFFVEELVRETCFERLEQEVPYGTEVRVREFREDDEPLYIAADLLVERESQKGIVIGRGGRTIRVIGTEARRKIEAFLDRRVYLDLRVKVLPHWTRQEHKLARLGYGPPRGGR
jgi:GTP-binding protein Era